MNYDYSHSYEVELDMSLAVSLSDEDFEREFNIDREEREKFVGELQSDLDELRWEEEQAEGDHIDDREEAYADPSLYV